MIPKKITVAYEDFPEENSAVHYIRKDIADEAIADLTNDIQSRDFQIHQLNDELSQLREKIQRLESRGIEDMKHELSRLREAILKEETRANNVGLENHQLREALRQVADLSVKPDVYEIARTAFSQPEGGEG